MKKDFKDKLKYKIMEFFIGATTMILILTVIGFMADIVTKYSHLVMNICLIIAGVLVFYWLSSLFGYLVMEVVNHDLWFKANYGKGDEYFTAEELKEWHKTKREGR